MKTRQITAWIMASILMSTAFISCKKSDDTVSLPSIGGYNSSNDISTTNLIAHWSFEGNVNEDISKTAPTKAVNNSFGTGGPKGQSLSLANGYLLYPTISALNSASALSSFTISAWINVNNNGTTSSGIFALSSPTATDWGQMINFLIETNQKKAGSDSLIVHGLLGQYSSGSRSGQDNVNSGGAADAGVKYQVVKGAGKWTQVAYKYDASASTIDVYANGKLVSNSDYRQRGTLGSLVFTTPILALIGGWPNIATGFPSSPNQTFQGLFNGGIDEIRVYNKSLSDTDISALYNLEVVGR